MTSCLSNEKGLIILKGKNSTETHRDYTVVEESVLDHTPTCLLTLHQKKNRINSAILRIKSNNNQLISDNNEKYSYFAHDPNLDLNSQNIARVCPGYCRSEFQTIKKLACTTCNEICSFPMNTILDNEIMCQNDILEELMRHHHPKSRLVPDEQKPGKNRGRRTVEAARELADHYIYAHNMEEPVRLPSISN
jgi:hypothetical protein